MKLIKKRRNTRQLSKDIVVLYHGDCTDGFSAAWVVWNKFGDKAEYLGIDPDESLISGLVDKEVYMLDLVCRNGLDKLLKDNKKVVAIDHHITNKALIKRIPDNFFDLGHSAAVLAWKYFYRSRPVPKLLSYVEDIDLWKLKMPYTNEVSSSMDILDFSFDNWSRLAKDFESELRFKEHVVRGKILCAYQNKLIERLVANNSNLVEFLGYKVYAVNSPNFSSQIGNILAKKLSSLGIVWYEESDGSIHISLRSVGDIDVAKIAEKFGGGGHQHSAGFTVRGCSNLPWKTIKHKTFKHSNL